MTIHEPRSTDDGEDSDPRSSGPALVECIEARVDCVQACADACLGEEDTRMLARCIRLNLDYADVCESTGKILSRQTAFEPEMVRAALQACAEACRLCGEKCERHAEHHEHCYVCARGLLPLRDGL